MWVDGVVIALFGVGMIAAVVLPRWEWRWAPAVAVAATSLVGVRALFTLEFGSPWLFALEGGLFVAGLLAVRAGLSRARS